MMRYVFKMTKTLFLLLILSGVLAVTSFARVDYYLAAKQFDMTMPDGTTVPMWGFALDPGGACYNLPLLSQRLACIDGLTATVPGPKLVQPDGDVAIRIFLTNALPEPVSIIIPGQEMPNSFAIGGGTPWGPTWLDGSNGPRPSPEARVRSFGREAGPNGARNVYRWVNSRSNPLQPGTLIYHSGTHPQVQVQMGLYGAITLDTAAGPAYPGAVYTQELDLFFSEVDPGLHAAVAGGTYGTAPGPTSTLDYNPKYFLLQSYDGTGAPFDITIDPGSPACVNSGLSAGGSALLRMYNAGLRELAPMIVGSHFNLIAEGGKPYQNPRTQYQTLLMPGSTKDAIFNPAYEGSFHIMERRLNLTDATLTDGGMRTCLAVPDILAPVGPPGGVPNGVASSGTGTGGAPSLFEGTVNSATTLAFD